jgi:hypothetical protein
VMTKMSKAQRFMTTSLLQMLGPAFRLNTC